MSIRIISRDFGKTVVLNAVSLAAERMTWNAMGGPDMATIRVSAGPGQRPALMQLTQLLRCGVEIADENGMAWWGFVNQVEIHTHTPSGAPGAGVVYVTSLDELANSVAVRYREESPAPGSVVGWQFQTDWAVDSYSEGQYGVKEQIFSLGEGRESEALALRDAELAQRRLPGVAVKPTANSQQPTAREEPSAVGREPYAVLRCLGWWHSLDWRFFSEPRGYEGNLVGSTVQPVGDGTWVAAAQKIRIGTATAWDLREVWVKVKLFGAPADNLNMTLCVDSAGSPGAIQLTVGAAAAGMTQEYQWIKYSLASVFALQPVTDYWVRMIRSGAADAANHYIVAVDEYLNYARGDSKVHNGAAWAARTPAADLVFTALGEEESTTQLTAMAAAGGAGQFLTGVFVKDASGVQAHLYRAGKRRALEEIKELLSLGTSGEERLVGEITAGRALVVSKVSPSTSIDLVIGSDGIIRFKDGRRLGASDHPAGRWARVEGLPLAGGDYGPGLAVLIERAEWIDGLLRVFWE